MAWTTPKTWAISEVLTAANFNTHVRDNLRFLKGLDGTIAFEAAATFSAAAAAIDIISSSNSSGSIIRIRNNTASPSLLGAINFINSAGSTLGQIAYSNTNAAMTFNAAGATQATLNATGLGLGTTSPQGRLHGAGSVARWVAGEYDGLDGTLRTILTAGSVVSGLMGLYLTKPSTGNPQGSYITARTVGGGSSTYSIYFDATPAPDDNVDLVVQSDGSVTIQRTSGSLIYKVGLWLVYI